MAKTNKSARIRELHAAQPHLTATQIAAKVGVAPAYVHSVLWIERKKAEEQKMLGADRAVEIEQRVKALDVQVDGDHYKKLKIQPVEYIHANGIGYFEGNVIKYVTRWRDKGGIADLEKAKHYIDLLIEQENNE